MNRSILLIILIGLGITPALGETAKTSKDATVSSLKEMVFQWKKSSHSDGLTLYWSKVEGSPIIAFKGEGIVDAPIEKVASIILDTTRSPEWVDSLMESKVIRTISPTEFIEYDHVGTPFIMANRDFVSRGTIEAEPKTKKIIIHYQSVEDSLMPPLKKYIRGVMVCEFRMVPMTLTDQTYVEAEVHCDPKGGVPKWLVNFFQEGWPQTTFERLRKQAKKPDIQVLPVVENLLQKPAVKFVKGDEN